MTEHNRFDEKSWLDFGKNLLSDQGTSTQISFLNACMLGKTGFLDYIEKCSLAYDNVTDDKTVTFECKFKEKKFTEKQFINPPDDTQKILWDTFKDVPAEMLYSCSFWGYTIVNMIRADYIEPSHLAARLTNGEKSGIYHIEKALQSGKQKDIDDCVRRILRSMCNPAARGKRIVFNDFYLGKVIWRRRWAKAMAEVGMYQYIKFDFNQILKILDNKYYAVFSAKMHSQKSYISSKNTLGGLLLFLDDRIKANKKIDGKNLGHVIDRLSYLSAWKAIEVQEPKLNLIDIQNIAKSL